MDKRGLIIAAVFSMIVLSALAHAQNSCVLSVSLVNQDPYPAIQGDTLKLLFQVSGVSNPDCNGVTFWLDPGYEFSLTQNDSVRTLSGSTFTAAYKDDWLLPYTLNVNPDAPDGSAEVKAYYYRGTAPVSANASLSTTFNISVQESRADFEVYVTNYDASSQTITFQILNIAKVNVKAVTVTIPEQSNIQPKGVNTNIIGDLDSNEYSTADFKALPSDGNLTLEISYTDSANIRRTAEKVVEFHSEFFPVSSSKSGSSLVVLIVIIVIILIIIYWIYKKHKRKKRIEEERRNRLK
jgi:hypothetical protein